MHVPFSQISAQQYCSLYEVLIVTWQSLLADEQLASCPVLLLGNKIDIPGAASEDYIRQYFGLYGLTTGKVQSFTERHVTITTIIIINYLD